MLMSEIGSYCTVHVVSRCYLHATDDDEEWEKELMDELMEELK